MESPVPMHMNMNRVTGSFKNSSHTFVQPLQINIKRLALLVKFSVNEILNFFSYFSKKTGFDISCKLSLLETICMKCLTLFSGKIRKLSPICRLLN